jgi:hypothetical protein
MSESIGGYKHAGDVDVRTFKLITAVGQVIDLESITVEFSVYQSLFEHYLQCDLVLNDSLGLINTLNPLKDGVTQGGFSGGDLLVVSYRSNDETLPYKSHVFALYEMTDRKRLEENSEAYFFSGISIEAYGATTQKISRSYGGSGGNDISSMVKSITEEFIYSSSIKDLHSNLKQATKFRIQKENDFEKTIGKHKYVIPNLSVDDTIDFLCKEVDNDDHIPYYLFYENSKGFNFKNLGTLVNQEPKETYSYISSNFGDSYKDKKSIEYTEATNIRSFDVLKQGNFLENLESGLFQSRTIHIDVLRKNKREVVYKYDDYFSKFKKLQNLKIAGGETKGDPVVRMFTSRKGHDSDSLFSGEAPNPKRYTEHIGQSEAYLSHTFNTQLEVVVPGDSELDVGDVIVLNIPPATNVLDQVNVGDKYLSGKYLVTKIRNKFLDGSESMSTILECVKDTGTKQ